MEEAIDLDFGSPCWLQTETFMPLLTMTRRIRSYSLGLPVTLQQGQLLIGDTCNAHMGVHDACLTGSRKPYKLLKVVIDEKLYASKDASPDEDQGLEGSHIDKMCRMVDAKS